MLRRTRWPVIVLALLSVARTGLADTVSVEVAGPARPLPHFWEQMFGSGRAALSLRAQYREDLRAVHGATAMAYVRFHGILHDELGVYDEHDGQPSYNFSYIDQIYDGLLAEGVRPVVEIGFMPRALALHPQRHPFWDAPIVSPPRDWARWDGLIRALGAHLIERYGIDEVAQWYFEVWNEPNGDFWTAVPKQSTYFELYAHTARALKAVDTRLRVGGPATAAAAWIPEFIAYANAEHVPLDFVSTHGYADDSTEDLFGTHAFVPWDQRVCQAARRVHRQIQASAAPALPLLWTEWNVPSFHHRHARDSAYVGAALAQTIRDCDGLVTMLSYWTFSDVFEEWGPGREPFEGMFGLVALGGIRKPSFTAWALLHRLGESRLPARGAQVLATRREDGSLATAVWNLVDPGQPRRTRTVRIRFRGLDARARARITLLDDSHGSSLAAYRAQGSPRYPSRAQVEVMNRAAEIPAPSLAALSGAGTLRLSLPPNGLALIELAAK